MANYRKSGVSDLLTLSFWKRFPPPRLEMEPQESHVTIGQNSIRYRRSVSSGQPVEPVNGSAWKDSPNQHSNGGPTHTASGSPLVDTTHDWFIRQIYSKYRSYGMWPIAAIVCAILVLILLACGLSWFGAGLTSVFFLALVACIYQFDQIGKRMKVNYELNPELQKNFDRLLETFLQLSTAKGIWNVTARRLVFQNKQLRDKNRLIDRARLRIEFRNPPNINTNLRIPCIQFNTATMYLMPDFILVYSGRDIQAIEYGNFQISFNSQEIAGEDTEPLSLGHASSSSSTPRSAFHQMFFRKDDGINLSEELNLTSEDHSFHQLLQFTETGPASLLKSELSRYREAVTRIPTAERITGATDLSVSELNLSASGLQVALAIPEVQEINEAIFFLNACVMIVDGKASTEEQNAIRQIMTNLEHPWTSEECSQHLKEFISIAKKRHVRDILKDCRKRISVTKSAGMESQLLEMVQQVALADGAVKPVQQVVIEKFSNLLNRVDA